MTFHYRRNYKIALVFLQTVYICLWQSDENMNIMIATVKLMCLIFVVPIHP